MGFVHLIMAVTVYIISPYCIPGAKHMLAELNASK